MKIAFFEVHDWERKIISEALAGHEVLLYNDKIQNVSSDEWRDSDGISTFIYSTVSKDIINLMQRLKFIATRSTGFNHIDLQAAKRKGVRVLNVPSYGENTVAEHTFALILNLSRNVHKSYLRTLQGDFRIDDLRGFDLKGKTLGVIGGGHIGMHVVKIAKGFGMHVLVYTRHPDSFLASVLHFNYSSLDELLSKSDIVTLHVPLTKETTHLIDKKAISKMKDGAILINTSRGPVVDTDALYDALMSGKISGAGLDVIEGEELVLEENQIIRDSSHKKQWKLLYEDKQILRMPNVVFTPHNAFNSREALERILNTTIKNIRSCETNDWSFIEKNIVV